MDVEWDVEWQDGDVARSGTLAGARLAGAAPSPHWGLHAAVASGAVPEHEAVGAVVGLGKLLDVTVDRDAQKVCVATRVAAAPAKSTGDALGRLRAIRGERHSIFTESDLGPDPPVYLDYNASTPIAPEVAHAMVSSGLGLPCNPSSSHAFGRRAREHVAESREALASLVGAPTADCVTFCSCGTEASNWAIQGAVRAWRAANPGAGAAPHVVTLTIEHPATLRQCEALQAEAEATAGAAGATFTAVGADRRCVASAEAIVAAVGPQTCLVTVMLANNEVGSLQPVAEVVRLLDERAEREGGPGATRRVAVHVDASQALGKVPVDVASLGCDYLTVAGHKLYAPPGCGALVISPSAVWGVPPPLVVGAPQESGRRAGTVSVAMARALATAASLSAKFLAEGGAERLWATRERLRAALGREFASAGLEAPSINGPEGSGDVLPNTLSLSLRGVSAKDLLRRLDGVLAASLGSACASLGCGKASGVAEALDLPPDLAPGTLRLSVGKQTTGAEVDLVAAEMAREVASMLRGAAAEAGASAAPPAEGKGVVDGAPLRTDRLYFASTSLLASVGPVLDACRAELAASGALSLTLGGEAVEVRAVEGCFAVVVLDATAAHPQGGGQPADRGVLVSAGPSGSAPLRFPLLHVTKGPMASAALRDAILHFVGHPEGVGPGGAVPAPGARCAVLVDAAWREQSARLHSAGHLLDAAIRPLAPSLVPTVGYHFPDRPNVSYAGKLTKEECSALVPALQERCDALVASGGSTTVHVFEAGDAEAAARAGLKPSDTEGYEPGSTVRVVAVAEPSNVCPCGGTHVLSASELAGLTITGIKCKKQTTKVSYTLTA